MKLPLTDAQARFLQKKTNNYYDELLFRDMPDIFITLFIQVGVLSSMRHYRYYLGLNLNDELHVEMDRYSENYLRLYLQDNKEII